MAAPTWVGVGTSAAATTAITPGFPGSLVDGDILIGLGESVGGELFTVPTGWAHVAGSPVNIDTTTCLTVLWKRYAAGDVAASWGDPGNHGVAQIGAIRGCIATGSPWAATPTTSPDATLNTTATWPAVTTVTADCLILFCIATGRDLTTTNLGALTGGTGLTNIVEQMDVWNAAGTGGGVGLVTATKAAAGSTGAPTATMGTNEPRAMMTLPLAPASAPPPAALPLLVMAH